VEKTVDIPEGSTSTRVNFTIMITNTGNATLDPVVAADTLPFGLDDPAASGNGSVSGNLVTWSLGEMKSGDSRTVWLTAHINGSAFGNLTNMVEVEGKPEYGENVTDNDTENVTAQNTSVSIDKTANVSFGSPSTNVLFTINVTNTGDADFTLVAVRDVLPTGLDYVSSNPTPSSVVGNDITWYLTNLDATDLATIELVAHISGTVYGNLTNEVAVSASPEHGNNVTDNDTENVTAQITSVAIDKVANVSSGSPSTNVLFTINVTNTGDADFTAVTVTDNLPAGLDYVSSNPTPSSVVGNEITWYLTNLNATELAAIELIAHISGTVYGNLTNGVYVTAEPEHGNNVTDNDTENVTAQITSVAIDKTANVSFGSPSTNVLFTINVTNTGDADFTAVTVTDNLPTGLDYVSSNPTPSSVIGNEITWYLTNLDATDFATIELVAHISGTVYGNLTNGVYVTAEPEHGNNVTDNDTENVTAQITSVAIDKTANVSSGSPSTNVLFTINVTNTGDADFTAVTVTDNLPTGLDYVSSNPTPSSVVGNEITWYLTNLNATDFATIELVAHISGTVYGNLTNEVAVSAEPEHGNNVTDNDNENVTAQITSISIDKTANVSSGSPSTNVLFTINVTNTGDADFTAVTVTDNLPAGLDYVSDNASGIENPTGTVTWIFADLDSGESRRIELVGHISGSAYGLLTNGASVTAKPEHGNNVTDDDTENVTAVAASISVDKTANVSSGSPSSRINFTLVVANTGNATLDPVIATDPLPFGLDEPVSSSGGLISGNVATWSLGKMSSGETRTLWLEAHINGSAFGNLTNYAHVEGKPEHGDNVTDGDSVNVTAVDASIRLDKTTNVSSGSPSTRVNFTLQVTNTGDATLDPVIVTDTLPFGLDDPTASGDGSVSGNVATWNLGGMSGRETRTLWLTAHINGSAFGNLTNYARVEGKPEHGDNVTDDDSANVTAVYAGISVHKVVDIPVGEVCTNVTFTIFVNNTGNARLDPVIVTDTLPLGLEYVSSTPPEAQSGNTIIWNLGGVEPGEMRIVYLVAHINGSAFGNLTNLVEVEGKPEHGDDVTDNDTENVTALGAEIDVEKTVDISVGSASTRVNFTILVNNTGKVALDPVLMADTLPYGLDEPVASDGGSISGNTVTWNLGRLNVGDARTIYLEAHINGSAFDNLTNYVEVEGDPEFGENVTDNDTVNVTALEAKIDVEKIVNIPVGSASTRVNFTIVVSNVGSADLDPVIVTDTLPLGLDNATSTSGGTESGSVVTWNLGRLNVGDARTLYLEAHINGSNFDNLTNVVFVEGKPEHGDNVTDADSVNVTALEAAIEVNKTVDRSVAENGTIVNFSMVVTNTGAADLDPVVVTDTLPTCLEYQSSTFNGSESGGVVTWNLGRLNSSDSRIITLSARANCSGAGILTNLVEVEGKPENGDNVTDKDTAEVTVVFDHGLSIEKKADKLSVQECDELTYTITVCNNGLEPEKNVTVWDVFDRYVEILSMSPAPGADDKWHFSEIPAGECVTITIKIKVPERQDFEFEMEQGVSGEGFVNVDNDYSTTFEEYVIKNCAYAISDYFNTPISDCVCVTVGAEMGTELETREHGSGSYESEELVGVRTENRSISMDKDMASIYAPTALGLYRNRTVAFSSRWTEEAEAKNRVTGTSMSESYRYATSIDRESRMLLDENQSSMKVESEFEGMGHLGFLKMPTGSSTPQATPLFEAAEDYTGSFRVLENADEYGSGVSFNRSAAGEGLVVGDRRLGQSQRSYESGAGSYASEELIKTYTSYMAKDISVVNAPMNQSLTGDMSINSSMKWKEGMYSRVPGASYIGEEYTGLSQLDKETVARGLNEMDTLANFSGQARYRAILKDEVDFDEAYSGDYSVERKVVFSGTAKYDRPHLNVTKTLDGIVEEKDDCDAYNCSKTKYIATYTIAIENDGNAALGPIYVKDFFPPGAIFVEPSSLRPTELTETSANWTLTHLAIGDVATITLQLDVTRYYPEELTNRVEVCGGHDGEMICAANFSALELNWLSCCLNETVSVTKTAEVDGTNANVVWYRIDIANNDNVTRAATVTDHLPEGMVLLDAMVPFASYDSRNITWNLIDIEPFETVTIPYRVTAQHPGRFVNSVLVDARSADGPVVQPVGASSVIEVGEPAECESTACGLWSPPNWEFEYLGSYAGDDPCEDLS